MRATLEFSLPEEAAEHRAAVKSGDLVSAVTAYLEWLRSQLKYGNHNSSEVRALERCREQLRVVVDDAGVAELLE